MASGDYLVGEWRFSPVCGEITPRAAGGKGARLEPKVAAVLVCLLEAAGEVVAKDDLMAAVWPDTFVGESAVFRHVSELRRALGDDARAPRYIETVPKRGYRLTAPVARIAPPPPQATDYAPQPAPTGAAPPREAAWRHAAAAAAVVVVALVLIVGLTRAPGPEPGPSLPRSTPRATPLPQHSGDPVGFETLAFARLFEDRVDCASYGKALELLESALARDDAFLPAYENVIDVSVASAVLGCTPTRVAMQRLEETLDAARLRGLDPARSHRARGHIALWAGWNPEVAVREFVRTRALMPADGERRDVGYAAALAASGRRSAALAEARRALAEEPTHPGTNWALATLLFFDHRIDDAVAQLDHTLELHPGFAPAQNLRALIELRSGDVQAARRTVGASPGPAAGGDRFATVPALVLAAAGDDEAARAARADWERRAHDGWAPPTAMALLYEGLGEREQAVQWLRRAVEEGDAWVIFLPIDPSFAPLRDDPSFRSLLAGVRVGRER